MRISDWSSDVCSSDLVENRIIDVPAGLPASSLVEASNYLSARLTGRTLEEAQAEALKELEQQSAELDQLTQRVRQRGLASWGGSQSGKGGARTLRPGGRRHGNECVRPCKYRW